MKRCKVLKRKERELIYSLNGRFFYVFLATTSPSSSQFVSLKFEFEFKFKCCAIVAWFLCRVWDDKFVARLNKMIKSLQKIVSFDTQKEQKKERERNMLLNKRKEKVFSLFVRRQKCCFCALCVAQCFCILSTKDTHRERKRYKIFGLVFVGGKRANRKWSYETIKWTVRLSGAKFEFNSTVSSLIIRLMDWVASWS